MLNEIQVQNFRNISKLVLKANSKGTVVIAPNGSGKTNILESIHYCLTASSFRPLSSNGEVVGPKNEYAKVSLTLDKSLVECIVRKTDVNIDRRFLLNGKRTTTKKLLKSYPIVLFAPHSVDIVSGDPSNRRDDLDRFLSSIDSNYHSKLSRYNQVLKNRNALLKIIRQNRSKTSELDVWTKQLVESSEYIFQTRYKFFQEIKDFVTTSAKEIYSDFDDLEVVYVPNTSNDFKSYRSILEKKFDDNIEKEIIVGKTLYGSHKDDYIFVKGSFNLRYMGSRGQQRIGAFIFKTAQLEFMKQKIGGAILLLLDDVLSELDPQHRSALSNSITKGGYQFILTSSDEREIPKAILDVSTRISLDSK